MPNAIRTLLAATSIEPPLAAAASAIKAEVAGLASKATGGLGLSPIADAGLDLLANALKAEIDDAVTEAKAGLSNPSPAPGLNAGA
jgi:hypothetical protein